MKFSWPTAPLIVLAFNGCASAPVRYYSLTPSAEYSSKAPRDVCCRVDLRNVRLPSNVDRQEIVLRRSSEEMDVLANDVWLAPLRDEIKDALLAGIRHYLESDSRSDKTVPVPRFIVLVEVERFESVLAKQATIQARWRVETTATTAYSALCTTAVSIRVDDGIPALVQGHQHAIAIIANQIAADILETKRTGLSRCIE